MSHATVTSLLEESTADSPGYIEICGKSKFCLLWFECSTYLSKNIAQNVGKKQVFGQNTDLG